MLFQIVYITCSISFNDKYRLLLQNAVGVQRRKVCQCKSEKPWEKETFGIDLEELVTIWGGFCEEGFPGRAGPRRGGSV